MNNKSISTLICLVILLFSCEKKSFSSPSTHPNLLFIFADQHRGQALGFLGEEPVITPELDKLAASGIAFPQAVVNYPLCSPYRAMFLSGNYPHKNKVVGNCNSATTPHNCQLQESDRCWSDVLKDQGYSLGYIGKWHLESPIKPYVKSYNNSANFAWNEWTPPNRRHGFDYWYAYNTYDQHMNCMYWNTKAKRDGHHKATIWGPTHEADKAIAYLENKNGERQAGKPFALVVAMNPPHMPYTQFPKKYLEPYKNISTETLTARKNIPAKDTSGGRLARNHTRNYFAMITGVDEQVGRILKSLKKQGLTRNTIVVYTSDHGNCLGCHNLVAKNNHYEESMRVPFIVSWPAKLKPRRDNLLISSPDIYPTLLDLMGFKNKLPKDLQGVSHAEVFLTGQGPRPSSQLYIHIPSDNISLGRRGVRTKTHTLMISKMPDKDYEVVLHDNAKDHYQLRNIAKENPELVISLTQKELLPWLKKNNDPFEFDMDELKAYLKQ